MKQITTNETKGGGDLKKRKKAKKSKMINDLRDRDSNKDKYLERNKNEM